MTTGDVHGGSGIALGSGESDTYTFSQPGADSFSGVLTRQTTTVDIDVVWIDDDGNDTETEEIESGFAAGSQATWDIPARTARCRLVIADSGTGSGTYTFGAHLR